MFIVSSQFSLTMTGNAKRPRSTGATCSDSGCCRSHEGECDRVVLCRHIRHIGWINPIEAIAQALRWAFSYFFLWRGVEPVLNSDLVRIITDRLRLYGAANRELGLSAWRERNQHQDNRAKNWHQPICKPQRNLRPFKSPGLGQPMVESHTGSQGINFWSPYSQPRPSRH
jgi:hypothetical protein